MSQTLDRFAPAILALTRIMAGLLFMEHGLIKMVGFPAGIAPGPQAVLSFSGISGVIELAAGALIVLGLLTRFAAFIASGEMAVGYFVAHATRGFFPAGNGGDAAILFCFFFLYLVVAGPGPFSLDRLFARASAGPAPAGAGFAR